MMLLMCVDNAHLDAIEVHVQRQLGSYYSDGESDSSGYTSDQRDPRSWV